MQYLLFTAAESRGQCLTCHSVELKNKDGRHPVLPASLKRNGACIDGATTVDFKQCHLRESCMTVKATVSVTANLTDTAEDNSTTWELKGR